MTTPQVRIPVRYVGAQEQWRDHLYGSDLVFRQGRVRNVPDWAAVRLLRHPEFEDARKKDEAGTPIIAGRRPVDEEAEREELQEIAQNVRLQDMSREQLAAHAQRTFGVHLDITDPKLDVLDSVRHLGRLRGVLV